MPESKARPLNESGEATVDSRQAAESADGKPAVSRESHAENIGQRSADRDRGGKETTSSGTAASSDRDSDVGRTTEEDDSAPGGKQTIESSRREASLGQRPTRDDGANDDKGELK